MHKGTSCHLHLPFPGEVLLTFGEISSNLVGDVLMSAGFQVQIQSQ